MSEAALPRAFELVNQGPGLLAKRKFSVWHLLSSSYFHKIGLRSSLESYYGKSASVEEKVWMPTSDKSNPSPSRSSSATSTPSKRSPEKCPPAIEGSPVVRPITEFPLFPDPSAPVTSGKMKKNRKKNSSSAKPSV